MNFIKLRTLLWFIPLVSISTTTCGVLSFLLSIFCRSGHPSHWVAKLWAWSILKVCMVRVELSGSEHLESTTSYVLASNHQSLFDTAVLFACLPLPFRVLYKKELNKIPFLGWHLSLGGHIGIDRDNPMQARQSLNAAAERVRAGTSVVVFPEGTRSYQGVMSRFKKGSFRLAIKAATPVVPITILDSYKIMTRGRLTVCPGTVQVTIGRPISVDALVEDDAGRLAERAEAVVLRTLRAR